MISVLKPGVLTTIQDLGRSGFRAFGMPMAGAVDVRSHSIANLLAGNSPDAATLEMTLLGGTFRFDRAAYVALAGADMQPKLDGVPMAMWSAFPVDTGSVLALGSATDGCRTYLAVHGGIDVPAVLGSRSTYVRAAVGGLAGRALAAGDSLPLRDSSTARLRARVLPSDLAPPRRRQLSLRALIGPQDERFTAEGMATFLESAYTVTNRNDRMGYALEGPTIHHADGPDIVSDGLLPGAVQVPGSGMPIVLMADCQTTGGYAKIAAVIGPDLSELAQARRGDTVRFRRCTMEQAVGARRAEREQLRAIANRLDSGATR
ncbi:MAG TPA: biotin-dependent carboxyltransferase family protein [Myxococcaceae bacterium]|nr:biotin-dependent carboxyltransferase family protein [Myxococcaceae bacterium]